ncbi:MAG: hypothetical protein ABL921_24635, partial [Pirellula sp.]
SLPVLVNMDGFYLSFTREPVEIPEVADVRKFLPPFAAKHPGFRASAPVAHGVAVLEGSVYSYFRYQMHLAMQNAIDVHQEVAKEFAERFGRSYGLVEKYRMDDADTVLVMAGSFSTKGKAAVNIWREQGLKVGLLRLRMLRPFPATAIVNALSGRRAVAVIDQNISPGFGGILFHEIAASLWCSPHRPQVLRSFIGGLGGKDIGQAEFNHVLGVLHSQELVENSSEPQLLFTEEDSKTIFSRLKIAGKTMTASGSLSS